MSAILSVVVPSYNVEQYLDKCLTSFSDHRFDHRLEVIIANDGSKDRTQEIAEGYVEKFPHIFKLINKENGGHGSAVNVGIENATGKYFRIVDGDDWVHTENMVKLLEILEASTSDMVVDERREVHMVTGETTFFPLPEHQEKEKQLDFKQICNDFEMGVYITLHTLSYKTELLKQHHIRLQEHIFYVDIEYIIKATMEAKTIEFHDLEIYQYLVGNVNQSVSCQNYVKRFSHHSQVTRSLITYATQSKAAGEMRTYLDRRICLLINTHMTIALIYNTNRKEGWQQAKDFRKFLKETNVAYLKRTRKRYLLTSLLHLLGIDYDKLQKLK
jgi:glycosyltransferase involved in cell wall biosynthesis